MDDTFVFQFIESIATIIGLILVIFGWIIPSRKELKNNFELQNRQWKKAFVDRQISELYGPLDAIITMQNMRRNIIKYQFGRPAIFKETGELQDLSEDEEKQWVHFVDTYVLPSLNEIIELFKSHRDLMFESEIPEEVKAIYKYAISFEMASKQYKDGVPNYYQYHSIGNYPVSFNNYVNRTLKKLKEEQKKLMGEQNISKI